MENQSTPQPSVFLPSTDDGAGKNKKLIIILAVALGVVVASVFLAMFAFRSDKRVEEDRVVVDETVNWQTYQNEEYGYEIKYPNNFVAMTKGFQSVAKGGEDFVAIKELDENYSVMSIAAMPVETTFDDFIKEKTGLPDYADGPKETIIGNKIVDGEKGVVTRSCFEPGCIENIYIVHNGLILNINTNEVANDEKFNFIISTFKFISNDEE